MKNQAIFYFILASTLHSCCGKPISPPSSFVQRLTHAKYEVHLNKTQGNIPASVADMEEAVETELRSRLQEVDDVYVVRFVTPPKEPVCKYSFFASGFSWSFLKQELSREWILCRYDRIATRALCNFRLDAKAFVFSPTLSRPIYRRLQ